MRQTTVSVSLEVEPASCARLTGLIDALHDRGSADSLANQGEFAPFMRAVPLLHFLSMSVFPSADFDPLLVIEANFDGSPGPFWAQLEAVIGAELRDMLRCCKRPNDGRGPHYDAVTQPQSKAALAGYLERLASHPSVYHHGNRGLTRGRIVDEAALFGAIEAELKAEAESLKSTLWAALPTAVHADLRHRLEPRFPWLNEEPPVRIPPAERAQDWARLGLVLLLTLSVLMLPGMIAGGLARTRPLLIWIALVALPIWIALIRLAKPLDKTSTSDASASKSLAGDIGWKPVMAVLLLVALHVPLVMAVGALAGEQHFVAMLRPAVRAVGFGVLVLAAIVAPGLLLWLRTLERRDSSQDAPPVDEELRRQMAQREDWIAQNHMGSVVLLRPGVLRAILVRFGHHVLHLALRATYNGGYLGSMRTIHFAHWAFVDNRSRLLFLSNFDQSWESYLDDFIEKAHVGLTLAWGCGVGFPPTRLLVLDGASHGRQFKAWARHSMTIGRFWYSAYPNLTVNQIERNNRIANGLRQKDPSAEAAAAWMLDL